METIKKHWIKSAGTIFAALVITLIAHAQTAPQPVLTITSLGTNQFSINITNNIGTNEYDLLWTPVLSDPDYPWMWAAIGTPGQTNFVLNMYAYQAGYFLTFHDTNTIPLWEAANPTNQSAGTLTVTINTPINGSVVQ